jgi:hypothetical protein
LLFLLVQITHCYPVWKLLPRKLAPQIVVISSKRGFQITVHPEPLVNFDRSIHLHGTRPLYRTHAESELSHPLFEVVSGWPTLASEGGGTRRRAYDQHLLAPATLADPCQEACKPATSGFFKAACPAPLESCRKNEVCFFAFTSVNERRNTYPATMSSRKKNAQNGEIFEMAPTLGDGENMLATDGRAGNEEDQRHMLRLGKTPELRVSRHYHRH